MLTAIDIRRLCGSPTWRHRAGRASRLPDAWSRTMFAGEIAKPTSLCFGGFAGDALAGYIISRHVDAWHVMNVAVDRAVPPPGPRAADAGDLFAEPPTTARAATRSRCASRTTARSASTSACASSRPASAAATTRTTARTP